VITTDAYVIYIYIIIIMIYAYVYVYVYVYMYMLLIIILISIHSTKAAGQNGRGELARRLLSGPDSFGAVN